MSVCITDGRYAHLKTVYEGFKRTGVSLVEYDNGQFLPCLVADDIGYYCIIPRIMRYLHLDLDTALYFFVFGTTAISVILALIAFFKLYSSWTSRTVFIIGLMLLTRINFICVDVYKIYTTLNVAIIPWALYFAQSNPRFKSFAVFTFLAGIAITCGHYIRAYAGLAALAFVCIIIITHATLQRKQKLILFGSLLLGSLCSYTFFFYEYYRCTQYAAMHFPHQLPSSKHHNVWHPIYCGLGFLTNKYDLYFADGCGGTKVYQHNPNTSFYSEEWDTILKNAVIELIKTDPWFILLTIWAKIGVSLMYILIFANLGLLAALFFPKGWRIELAFLIALMASTIKNIVVNHGVFYSMSIQSCATLYGIVSLCYALNSPQFIPWLKTIFMHCKAAFSWSKKWH